MRPEIASLRSKLERALQHRSEMQELVKSYLDSDIFEISTELDYRKRVVGRAVNVKTPGPELSVLIGDFVHSLRSFLDQAVFQIATAETQPMPQEWAKTSAFPIFNSGPEFRGEGRSRGAAYKMRGLPASAKTRIEHLQPFHRRRAPLLWAMWQLEQLSNMDKHRQMPLTGAIPASGSVSIEFKSSGVKAFGHQIYPGPIEERRRMMHVRTEGVLRPEDVELGFQVKPYVAFDRRSDPPAVRGWPLAEVVDGILAVFAVGVLPNLNSELLPIFGRGVGSIQLEDPPPMPT